MYVEGNIIDLGTYQLQVAEACSGLRYLLPLICISFLVSYLYKAPFWKKLFVVVSAVPITIVINSFRIAVTAILVDHFGTKMAEGFLHEFEGWVIFLIGVALLGFELLALERFRWSKVEIEPITDLRVASHQAVDLSRIALPLVVAVIICAGTLGVTASLASAYKSTSTLVRQTFADFPRQIGQWVGKIEPLDSQTINLLKATDYYSGDFIKGSGSLPVDLFVVYYDSLSKGAAIHSPRVCLPGSGWEFASFKERNFSEVVPGMPGTYNNVLAQNGERKILMYYWYQQRARRTADEFSMKYYLLIDNLLKGRRDGALVRLSTVVDPAAGEHGVAEANARLRAFAQGVVAKLPSYVPQ